MNDPQELLRKLSEDGASPDQAAERLPTMQRLAEWEAPQATVQETARLVALLQAQTALQAANRWEKIRSRLQSYWPWLLLRAQMRVVHSEIWAASALVMVLGILVTWATYRPGEMLAFAILAPVATALGIAYLYGPEVSPSLEVELATPASPRLVLLARLALVFGFNLGLGLLSSFLLAGLGIGSSLGGIIGAWLAPMTFLSALALFLSVLVQDASVGALLSLGVWIYSWIRQMDGLNELLTSLPNPAAAEARPWLWMLALLLGGIALWLSGREERWLKV